MAALQMLPYILRILRYIIHACMVFRVVLLIEAVSIASYFACFYFVKVGHYKRLMLFISIRFLLGFRPV